MSQQNLKRVMMLLSIVESGKGKELIETLNEKNISLHFQSVGQGTAPTEMMDIFGLGSNRKDVIFSFANETIIKNLMLHFGDNFSSYSKYKGLMMVLGLSSMNRLIVGLLNHNVMDVDTEGEESKMKNSHNHSLVMIAVEQGYTDEVMEVAKRAGATGGTVIKGRLAENERISELANIQIADEREIIFILAPNAVSQQIMDEVNKVYGLKSDAHGILWTVPVDKAYKI